MYVRFNRENSNTRRIYQVSNSFDKVYKENY